MDPLPAYECRFKNTDKYKEGFSWTHVSGKKIFRAENNYLITYAGKISDSGIYACHYNGKKIIEREYTLICKLPF